MPRQALLLAAASALFAAAPALAERRCGWLDNPTPANWWLTDRDGEWTIMTQGGPYPDGMEENMPDMSTRGWVRTNGSYGYGCACMEVETDRRQMRVTRILSARAVPIRQCRADRRLPRRR